MANPFARVRWRPAPATLIASGVVVLGFLLTGVSWGFLALVAVGTFGPGILRELGWLKDKDEFERRAARRAGYHAYLVGGFITFLIVAYMLLIIFNPVCSTSHPHFFRSASTILW